MRKFLKFTAIFAAAALLGGCSGSKENSSESLTELTVYSAEPDITDIPGGDGTEAASNGTLTAPGELTAVPVGTGAASDVYTSASSGRDIAPSVSTTAASTFGTGLTDVTDLPPMTTQKPPAQTDGGIAELTPDADSGETLVMSIDVSKISKIKYSAEQIVERELYTENSVVLTKSAFKTELAEAFGGLVYLSVSAKEKNAENSAYAEWRDENQSVKVSPETLTFLDKNGNELARFTSDTYYALGNGEQTTPLVRAFVNGKEYELFYGNFKYSEIQYTILSQMLVSKGFFTLDTYGEIAKTAVSSELSDFESQTPEYRVYSPDRALVLSDGTVKYPEAFPSGTLLVDCTFGYSGGGIVVVTVNASGGSILQTEQRY